MATAATTTLTVNAAFLHEIKEDHVELKELLARVHQLLSQPVSKIPARELVDAMLDLQDRLAMHFSLEEAFGYCQEAIDVAPRLSAQAALLQGEHETLFLEFSQIVEEAEQLLYHEVPRRRVRQVAGEFDRFHGELQEHERRECELILAAYDDDLGVGD